MVNGGEFVGGALLGAGFGPMADLVRETIEKSIDFKPSLENLQYTQKSLQPCVDKIEALNIPLGYPDEIKDLKAKMLEGDALDSKFKDVSVWNLGTPLYTDQLVELEESRRKQLEILKVQGIRDVKENLVLARESNTGVKQIVTWTGKTSDQLIEVASYGKEALTLGKDSNKQLTELTTAINRIELVGLVKDNKVASVVEGAALGAAVDALGDAVDEARLKPTQSELLKRVFDYFDKDRISDYFDLKGAILEDVYGNFSCEELKMFRIEIEKGVEMVRKCSNVRVWTSDKTDKYAEKIRDLEKSLQALTARLKV